MSAISNSVASEKDKSDKEDFRKEEIKEDPVKQIKIHSFLTNSLKEINDGEIPVEIEVDMVSALLDSI